MKMTRESMARSVEVRMKTVAAASSFKVMIEKTSEGERSGVESEWGNQISPSSDHRPN